MTTLTGFPGAGIPFDSLMASLSAPPPITATGNHLVLAQRPNPFVKPTLESTASIDHAMSAEILFVVAYAAVGKTTMAHFLSSELGIPLLDLATVPVSTGSLKALLYDVYGVDSPVSAFHAGSLPIIVDALDEGRLLSGAVGLESFLTSAARFLMEDRRVTTRPKLLIFGRHESVEEAAFYLTAEQPLTTRRLEVRFFDQQAARELIHAHAKRAAKASAAYHAHPIPVNAAIDAYFSAIESALEIDNGDLWLSPHGRAFAGYAPVLAAIGRILADLENYPDLVNKLKGRGLNDAWKVFETVIEEILRREQTKVKDALTPGMPATSSLPEAAFDVDEQLTLLCQYVHNQPLSGSSRVQLDGAALEKYRDAVNIRLPEHPFVLPGKNEFSNAVLGSVVMAHAVITDALRGVKKPAGLANLARQPFLYRAVAAKVPADSLIDGVYVGYILNSYWSEPLQAAADQVSIELADEGAARVNIPAEGGEPLSFVAAMPIVAYEQLRNCFIDLAGEMTLVGGGSGDGTGLFSFVGEVCLRCDTLDVAAKTIAIDGRTWLEARELHAPQPITIKRSTTSEVGLGGTFCSQFPWRDVETSLNSPFMNAEQDVLAEVVAECARHLKGHPVVLNKDLAPTEDDEKMNWARRLPIEFRSLMDLMVEHGLATAVPIPAGGEAKFQVRFEITWDDLGDAVNDPRNVSRLRERFPEVQNFIERARARCSD